MKRSSKAKRIKFDIEKIFPAHEPQSVPLLRLMMATDDVRHLQKLLLSANARAKAANEIEKSILNGEILHLFKLLSGHLYEAGHSFRILEQKCSGLLDSAVADNCEREKDLKYLRRVYALTPQGSFHYAFLKPIRHYFAFHYKEQELNEALDRHIKAKDLEGNLIVVEYSGLGRYSVTDHFALSAIQALLGTNIDEFTKKFTEKMGEVITLAGALSRVVDDLLLHILKRHSDAIIETRNGKVSVPSEILGAKEKVE